ncbi:MAG TPA: YceI family protein [Steroidobacteraceae bacterium]|jgi:polyisoprenoid-binding protein YceI|nr:YceI family protein [Steroidobacteraceae bacterium]
MRASIRTAVVICLGVSAAALAAPVTYEVDARHTHPSFEADHFGGVSVWRGMFTASGGTIVLDREAKTGTVDVTIDTTTVLTGVPDLDKHLKTGEFLDVEKFPTAQYKGRLAKFANGAPTEVQGDLTLHGVTKPVVLTIKSFKCKAHPMKQGQELCGADAHGTINREDFGITWGKNFGFDMKVNLAIQVEATSPKK